MQEYFVKAVVCILVVEIVPYAALQVLSTVPSGNVMVAVNHQEPVVFHCSVEGGVAFWEIGTHSENEYRDRGVVINTSANGTHSTVSITPWGMEVFQRDNISVRCYMFNSTLFDTCYGNYSYILRYGAPSTPTNLHLTPTHPPRVTWTRSDIMEGAPVNYSLYIVNVRTGEQLQHNITSQEGVDIIQVPNRSTCDAHFISLTAWNEVGWSREVTKNQTIPLLLPDLLLASQSLRVEGVNLHNGSGVTATVSFTSGTECSPDYPLRNHTISVEQLPSSLTVTPTTSNSSFFTAILTTEQFPGLVANQVFRVRVNACNGIGCRASDSVELRTLDLHSASVAYSRTSSQVYLQCVYTNGSTASGCQFSATVTTSDGTHTQTVTVSREESSGSCATIVGFSDFSVSALDSSDQVVGPAVAPSVTEEDRLPDCPASSAVQLSGSSRRFVVVAILIASCYLM